MVLCGFHRRKPRWKGGQSEESLIIQQLLFQLRLNPINNSRAETVPTFMKESWQNSGAGHLMLKTLYIYEITLYALGHEFSSDCIRWNKRCGERDSWTWSFRRQSAKIERFYLILFLKSSTYQHRCYLERNFIWLNWADRPYLPQEWNIHSNWISHLTVLLLLSLSVLQNEETL